MLRRTVREFLKDQCIDLAAALTYYTMLALVPAMVAVVSLVGLIGEGPETVDALLGVLEQIGVSSPSMEQILSRLSEVPQAGLALLLGLATALWSASRYVTSFSRAMNRVYQVGEGRPVWKLRPVMLLITLVVGVLGILLLICLLLSGSTARAIGDAIGLGSAAAVAWSIAKWPLMLVVMVLIVAILYFATPNVKQPRFRWMSLGALIAIVAWILASTAFSFYVANFSEYNKIYGSLAGVIIFLLWLWITNVALLFGAELDAEMERVRQLQAGVVAERTIQLPLRDGRRLAKTRAKDDREVERGRALRSGAAAEDSEESP